MENCSLRTERQTQLESHIQWYHQFYWETSKNFKGLILWKTVFFWYLGCYFWVYGAATRLETRNHPCIFEWDTDFWQFLPEVSRWTSQILAVYRRHWPEHLNIPTHYPLPSPHSVSTHQLQPYLLGDPPLCYESAMWAPNARALLLAVKTAHSMPSCPSCRG